MWFDLQRDILDTFDGFQLPLEHDARMRLEALRIECDDAPSATVEEVFRRRQHARKQRLGMLIGLLSSIGHRCAVCGRSYRGNAARLCCARVNAAF